jgi:nucleotide-binding universal stress UspA family protein
MMAAVWLTGGILRHGPDGLHRSFARFPLRLFRSGPRGRTDARVCFEHHDRGMRVILVATDGSRVANAALDEAIALAAETGDAIAAITVWRALQGDFGLAFPSTAMLSDLLDAEREHAEAALAQAAARAEAAGVRVRTRLTTGDPAELICAYAEEIDARLIAIGTRGYGTVASLLLGSVSNAVIRNAPCPVLVVREPDESRSQDTAGRAVAAH